MHQTVQCCFGKPTWRNWQTRTVQVRVPRGMRVRLPPSVPFTIRGVINTRRFYDLLRVWHNGCAPAFQAGYTGSTPVTRSSCQNPIENYICGWIPERSKGADCKSASDAFDGSNPSPATIFQYSTTAIICCRFFYLHIPGKIQLCAVRPPKKTTIIQPLQS